jgi:WD40 repeat protein
MFPLKNLIAICLCLLLLACENTPKAEKTSILAPGGLFSAALSEHYALLGTAKGNAELWQLTPKKLVHNWQHTDEKNGIIALAISEREEYAITAERDSIAWWRISDGTLLNVWSLPGITSVSISAEGNFALIGLQDKALYFALEYGKTLYAFPHQDAISATALSSTGKHALTGSDDGVAKLWDLTTGEIKYTWQNQTKLSVVALSRNDKYALTNAALGSTQIWNIGNGELFKKIGPNLMTLSSVRFSKNDKYLIAGKISQRIDLWRIKTGQIMKYWRPKTDDKWRPSAATILALSFTSNDKKFYSISSKGILQRWRK